MMSIEGFLGACRLKPGEICNSPSQFYALIHSVYGISADRESSFFDNVFRIQNAIASLPRETRKEFHDAARGRRNEIHSMVSAASPALSGCDVIRSENTITSTILSPAKKSAAAILAPGSDWSLPPISRTPISEDEIDNAATTNGGYTRKTLAGWGIPWPPMSGWRSVLLHHGYPLFEIDTSSKKAVKRSSDAAFALLSSRRGERKAKPVIAEVDYRISVAPKAVRKAFYSSWEWRTLRYEVLKEQGRVCSCCGARHGDTNEGGQPVKIVVDHIRPLSKYWDLRLTRSNLAVLCDSCNMGKGNWDETDWSKVA